jgi:hypothetical protein
LLHSAGQLAGPALFEWLNLDVNVFDQMVILFDRRTKNRRKKCRFSSMVKVLVKREFAGHITYRIPDLLEILYNVETIDRLAEPLNRAEIMSSVS